MLRATILAGKASGCASQASQGHIDVRRDFLIEERQQKLFFFLPSLFGILKNLLTFAAEQQNERYAKEKHPYATYLPKDWLVPLDSLLYRESR